MVEQKEIFVNNKEPETVEGELVSTELVPMEVANVSKLNLDIITHNQKVLMEHSNNTRELAMKACLVHPDCWNKFGKSFRPTAPAVVNAIRSLGINKKSWIVSVMIKNDMDNEPYLEAVAKCRMWYAAPQLNMYGMETTAITTSHKKLYGYNSKEKKYKDGRNVIKDSYQKISHDAESTAIVNCFCEFLGLKNISDTQMKAYNPKIEIDKINVVGYGG